MDFNLLNKFDFVFVTKPELKTYVNTSGEFKKDPSNYAVRRNVINKDNMFHYQKKGDKLGLIFTGKTSGITVLDIDSKKIYQKLIKKYPELNQVFTVETYNGYHMYFSYDSDIRGTITDVFNKYNDIGAVDIRNDGDIITAPGTSYIVESGEVFTYKYLGGELYKVPKQIKKLIKPEYFHSFKPVINEKIMEEVDKELDNNNFNINFHREQMELADEKYKLNYSDWVNFSFMCKNEDDSIDGDYFKLWLDYSNCESYKLSYVDRVKQWEAFKITSNNKITFKSLSYELKMTKPSEYNQLIKKYMKTKKNDIKFWDMMALFNNSDLAEYYKNITIQRFIYCRNVWYAYNEYNIITKLSEKTPSQLITNISDVLKAKLKEELKKIEPEDKIYDSIYKLFKSCYKAVGSSSFVKGMIDYIQSYYNDDKLNDKLDNNSNLLAFTDKLYDFKTHEFRNIEMTDFISITTGYKAPIVSDPKIEQEIKNIIYSVFENELMSKYWLESVSMSLYTNKFENFYIHTGSGRNGKGLLFSLIESALGNYISTADSEFLTTRIESGKPDPVLSKAKGKRFLMITEPSTEDNKKNGEIKMNVDLIKKLSGLDKIEARDLFQKSENVITYKPQFTCFLQCNQKPELGKLDNAIKERLKIIDYPFTFVDEPSQENERKKDINLKDKLSSQEYINEMILLLIKTCKNFTKFNIPETVFESNNNYFGACDPIKDWLYNNYIITKNSSDKIKTSELLKHFISENNNNMSSSKFINYMKFHNINTLIYSGINYFRGIKVKVNTSDLDV